VNYPTPLTQAVLLKRYKRFLADVEFEDGTVLTAHCANPGAMTGCWVAGCMARLSFHDNPKRKLKWSLEQTQVDGTWIAVNTAVHNRVVGEALQANHIAELTGYDSIQREQKYGEGSRIDFLLSASQRRCYVEVKGVSLVEDGIGLFPDSVTKRGQKHLSELMEVARQGHRAVMLFSVARGDIAVVRPADHIDPVYGTLLRQARDVGVELLAYRCEVGVDELKLTERLEVELPSQGPPAAR